jgi:hypothetical protein
LKLSDGSSGVPLTQRRKSAQGRARPTTCRWELEETVVESIENNVEAFLGMLRGDNTGKMIVTLPAQAAVGN